MLKIGRIYIYKNEHYFYIKSKRKYLGRIKYLIARVKSNGSLGQEKEILFKRGEYVLTDIKPIIHIPLPKRDQDKIYFQGLVDRAIEFARQYAKGNKQEIRYEISKLAYASIYFINRETGENYNLRDFAKAMKFKDYRKLYRWVGAYMKLHFTKEKFTKAIPSAADNTLVKNYANLNKMWGSLYGYNSELNELLKSNVRAYTKELKHRGIYQ